MKTLGIVCLCLALTLTGCDGGSGGSDEWDGLGTAIFAMVIGTAVVVVGGGAAIYNSIHRSQTRYHFKQGLNIKAPDKVGHDKTFEVKVAVANAKGKQQKDWWNADRLPEVSIATVDGAAVATLVKTEVKKEWHIGKYRATQPGLYQLTVKSPVPGTEPASLPVEAEITRDLLVK